MNSNVLVAARKKAEMAVADMRDGELKTKAFEVAFSHLLSSAPEVDKISNVGRQRQDRVSKPKKAPATAKTIAERVLVLKDAGFFDSPRSISAVKSQLATHGWNHPMTALSGKLLHLVQIRELRRLAVKDKNTKWAYTKP